MGSSLDGFHLCLVSIGVCFPSFVIACPSLIAFICGQCALGVSIGMFLPLSDGHSSVFPPMLTVYVSEFILFCLVFVLYVSHMNSGFLTCVA